MIESEGSPRSKGRNSRLAGKLWIVDSVPRQWFGLPWTYSGKLEDGTGSSLCPGWAAAGGSDASIDSSLPTSALASRSSGFFRSRLSISRSGASERTGGGHLSFELSVKSNSSAIGSGRKRASGTVVPGLDAEFDRPLSTGGEGISANGWEAV